ncbi:MAG: GSCFA domain-containing protein [Paracoccaceae bacterium]
MKTIPGPEAFKATLRNKARKFADREDARFQDGFIFPQIDPGFSISKSQSVFTIGSCFARNVEEVLLAQGITVPTAHFTAPNDEAPGRPNRVLNQYNPGTMLQCVQAATQPVDTRALYAKGDEAVDCLLATGSRPVARARAMERRQQIVDLYKSGLDQSEVVVVTLGLVEAWYDLKDGIYLNEAPPPPLINADPDRFEFRQLDVPTSQALIFEMTERLLEGGRRKIVMTVSPVPLQVTFAGGDALMRNNYSKSVLRIVAEMATQTFADVDYFPSYEIIVTAGLRSFGADNVHVRPQVVERVVNHMVSLYVKG